MFFRNEYAQSKIDQIQRRITYLVGAILRSNDDDAEDLREQLDDAYEDLGIWRQ